MGDDLTTSSWYQFIIKTNIFSLGLEVEGGLILDTFGISLLFAKSPFSYGLIHVQLVFLLFFLEMDLFSRVEEEEPK